MLRAMWALINNNIETEITLKKSAITIQLQGETNPCYLWVLSVISSEKVGCYLLSPLEKVGCYMLWKSQK